MERSWKQPCSLHFSGLAKEIFSTPVWDLQLTQVGNATAAWTAATPCIRTKELCLLPLPSHKLAPLPPLISQLTSTCCIALLGVLPTNCAAVDAFFHQLVVVEASSPVTGCRLCRKGRRGAELALSTSVAHWGGMGPCTWVCMQGLGAVCLCSPPLPCRAHSAALHTS